MSLTAYLRYARERAEQILRYHQRRGSGIQATCQSCIVVYPCDAVRAARDVLAICEALTLDEPVSRASLLKLLGELVDVRAPKARAVDEDFARLPHPNGDGARAPEDRDGGVKRWSRFLWP